MGSFLDQQTIGTYWLNKSEQLRNAAGCVWKVLNRNSSFKIDNESIGPPSYSVYFMLCGMSIESMFKAVLIEKKQKPPITHNLPKLAQLAGVTYNAHQMDLLQILSEAIYWDGRYPVPLDEVKWDRLIKLENAKLFTEEPVGDSPIPFTVRNNVLNWESYSELWDRAFTDLMNVAPWADRSTKIAKKSQ